MESSKGLSQEDLKAMKFHNSREYQAKFLLEPDIQAKEDFSHLDKNLAITNLKHNPKLHINEVAESRAILRGLHILNNDIHYKEIEIEKFKGHELIEEKEGKKIYKEIWVKKKIKVPKYPKTFHSLRSEFISLVNTTAARNGHRIDAAIKNILEKVETLRDQTNVKNKWSFGKK